MRAQSRPALILLLPNLLCRGGERGLTPSRRAADCKPRRGSGSLRTGASMPHNGRAPCAWLPRRCPADVPWFAEGSPAGRLHCVGDSEQLASTVEIVFAVLLSKHFVCISCGVPLRPPMDEEKEGRATLGKPAPPNHHHQPETLPLTSCDTLCARRKPFPPQAGAPTSNKAGVVTDPLFKQLAGLSDCLAPFCHPNPRLLARPTDP